MRVYYFGDNSLRIRSVKPISSRQLYPVAMATPNSNRLQKTKGKRSAQHSPPNCTGKKSKAEQTNCLVCEKVIPELDDKTKGHEALFCEGKCQGWIHRQCAGITRFGYDKLGESTIPFCVHTVR